MAAIGLGMVFKAMRQDEITQGEGGSRTGPRQSPKELQREHVKLKSLFYNKRNGASGASELEGDWERCVLAAKRGAGFLEGEVGLTRGPREVRYSGEVTLEDHALSRVVFSGEKG